MKKILLIVAVVLCIAIAGTAFAITRNNATPTTATLATESFLVLTLGRSSTEPIEVADGAPGLYTIVCDKTASASVADTECRLVINAQDTSIEQTLEHVTISVYSDAARHNLIETITGADTITIDDITAAEKMYYVTVTLDSGLDADETAAVGGTLSMTYTKEPAQQQG